MRICILEEAGDPTLIGTPDEDWPTYILPYLDGHACEIHGLEKSTSVERITALVESGFDIFINLCDGSWDSPSPGIEVVRTLEKLNVPFTGASSSFYDPSREEMKRICQTHGIGTPSYVLARSDSDLSEAAERLTLPLIVKHPNGYSSVGLTRKSRVTTTTALLEQGRQAIREYGGALIEEFIEGREFTVLVAENPDDAQDPIAYNPVEFLFPPGETFKHYDMKWTDFDAMKCVRVNDVVLAERLKEASKKMFVGLDGNGYGRCDIRVDEAGHIFMLEINPNCGVFYEPKDAGSADFVLLSDPGGHVGFINTIMRAALNRHAALRQGLPDVARFPSGP